MLSGGNYIGGVFWAWALGLEVWGPGGLGAWRSWGLGLGLGASAWGLLAVTVKVKLGRKNVSICFASIGGQ